MSIELLLKLNFMFYGIFLIVFVFLITMGQRVGDQIEKRKMALQKIRIEKRQAAKKSEFTA